MSRKKTSTHRPSTPEEDARRAAARPIVGATRCALEMVMQSHRESHATALERLAELEAWIAGGPLPELARRWGAASANPPEPGADMDVFIESMSTVRVAEKGIEYALFAASGVPCSDEADPLTEILSALEDDLCGATRLCAAAEPAVLAAARAAVDHDARRRTVQDATRAIRAGVESARRMVTERSQGTLDAIAAFERYAATGEVPELWSKLAAVAYAAEPCEVGRAAAHAHADEQCAHCTDHRAYHRLLCDFAGGFESVTPALAIACADPLVPLDLADLAKDLGDDMNGILDRVEVRQDALDACTERAEATL